MDEPVLRLRREEVNDFFLRGAEPPTDDEVSITTDGRRLDSRQAVLAWLADLEAERAALKAEQN